MARKDGWGDWKKVGQGKCGTRKVNKRKDERGNGMTRKGEREEKSMKDEWEKGKM
jgi:hypothetical protein